MQFNKIMKGKKLRISKKLKQTSDSKQASPRRRKSILKSHQIVKINSPNQSKPKKVKYLDQVVKGDCDLHLLSNVYRYRIKLNVNDNKDQGTLFSFVELLEVIKHKSGVDYEKDEITLSLRKEFAAEINTFLQTSIK